MIFSKYGDPRTTMRQTRDEVCPFVILEMSSSSVTPNVARRPRITASLYSVGIIKSVRCYPNSTLISSLVFNELNCYPKIGAAGRELSALTAEAHGRDES